MPTLSLLRRVIRRLIGWPLIRMTYRAHYRVMHDAHHYIVTLIEDNEDGEARRASLMDWEWAERPVLDVLNGTVSCYRIDGPRQLVENEVFALGSLIQSPGVTAHLDPIETLQLELRMREAIEAEILRWIAEHKLHELRPLRLASTVQLKTPRRLRGFSLGYVATTSWGSKIMPDNQINRGQERCVDTSYRAEVRKSHLTHWRAAVFCDFCDGPMARALLVAKRKLAFLGFAERAIDALRGVQS